jgi:hypothetical protein
LAFDFLLELLPAPHWVLPGVAFHDTQPSQDVVVYLIFLGIFKRTNDEDEGIQHEFMDTAKADDLRSHGGEFSVFFSV